MNILFIVDDFPPNWAPRVGYLCKYLHRKGHRIFVTSGVRNRKNVYEFLTGHAESIFFAYPRRQMNTFTKTLDIFESLMPVRILRGEAEIFSEASKILGRHSIDLVFTSTCDVFPAYTAYKFAKKNNLPLHVDFRDIYEQLPKRSILDRKLKFWPFHIRDQAFVPLYKIYRRRILGYATSCTTISPFHKGVLDKIHGDCRLIFNGFDHEVFYNRRPLVTTKFVMSYSGTLGDESISDHRLFIEAIQVFLTLTHVERSDIEINFFSGKIKENKIVEDIVSLNLTDIVHIRNWIPSDLLAEELAKSSVLLLFSKKESKSGPKGIVYTKIFEYMALNRPILMSPRDYSFNEGLLLESSAGVARDSVAEIVNHLDALYSEWRGNGYVVGSSNFELVSHYTRKRQAELFEQCFVDAVENKT
jgi:glycosyltransferase involved in cell wall biosynthesis